MNHNLTIVSERSFSEFFEKDTLYQRYKCKNCGIYLGVWSLKEYNVWFITDRNYYFYFGQRDEAYKFHEHEYCNVINYNMACNEVILMSML
jgi:hypothetical protein